LKILDVPNPKRIQRPPDNSVEIFSQGEFLEQGFKVIKVELRLYEEKKDTKLGPYSLITSIVTTDRGSIEMLYDEGYRGNDALESAEKFLSSNLGPSGLILRSIIGLKQALEKQNT
jgi:hypothetical protein